VSFGDESFLELIEEWDGLGVVVHRDRPTGAWIFIAMHDDTLGFSLGGCRMKVYPRPEEALRDALRLSEGMTRKWAAIGFPYGGGKTVIAVPTMPTGGERVRLMHRYGSLLNSLKGSYGTGADMGTTDEDMRQIATVSEYVIGVHGIEGGPPDPSPFTALGTYEAIRAALAHRHGSPSVSGRTVLVQGVGHVGGPLARRLAEEGARVLLSDQDQDRAFALSVEIGGSVVPPEDVYRTPCDVYSPCAIGATLNAKTIPLLACDLVVGAANNQLEGPQDADRLRERGILYAPDFIVNAGGAMAFTLVYAGERSQAELERRVSQIGGTLSEVLAEADERNESPAAAADRRVERVLTRARQQH